MVALISTAVSVQGARLPAKPIAKAPSYDVTIIGAAIYYSSVVVNNAGTVVANWGTDLPWDEPTHGYVASKEHMANLGPRSWATDINNKGIVCGQQDGIACYWTKTLRRVLLNTPGRSSFAHAISDSNIIVGEAFDEPVSAFAYDGTMRILSTEAARAYAVNNAGLVGGVLNRNMSNDSVPVLWKKKLGTYRQIELPLPEGAADGYVSALSDAGAAVGVCNLAHSPRATVWRYNGATGEYEAAYLPAFGGFCFAAAVNARGQIVGDGDMMACLWDNGQVYDLNDLMPPDSGCHLFQATGINDAGQISCLGQVAYDTVAVLLTPSKK